MTKNNPIFNLKQNEINLISLLNFKKINAIISQQNLTNENINIMMKRIEKLEDEIKNNQEIINQIKNLDFKKINNLIKEVEQLIPIVIKNSEDIETLFKIVKKNNLNTDV